MLIARSTTHTSHWVNTASRQQDDWRTLVTVSRLPSRLVAVSEHISVSRDLASFCMSAWAYQSRSIRRGTVLTLVRGRDTSAWSASLHTFFKRFSEYIVHPVINATSESISNISNLISIAIDPVTKCRVHINLSGSSEHEYETLQVRWQYRFFNSCRAKLCDVSFVTFFLKSNTSIDNFVSTLHIDRRISKDTHYCVKTSIKALRSDGKHHRTTRRSFDLHVVVDHYWPKFRLSVLFDLISALHVDEEQVCL